MARAAALAASGQLEPSRATLLETLALVPDDAVQMWVQLTVACANVEHFLGRHDLAQQRLAAALERLPDPATPGGRGPHARTRGRQHVPHGLRLRPEVGGAGARRRSTARRYAAHHDRGRHGRAGRRVQRRGRPKPRGCDARSSGCWTGCPTRSWPAARTRAGYLAAAELQLDRFSDAIAHAERGLEIARATGQMAPTLVPTLGTARFMRGLLSESAAVLDQGLEAARIGGIEQAIAWSLVNRSMAALAAWEVETALSTAEEAIELTQRLDESWISGWAGVAHAGALLRRRRARARGGEPAARVGRRGAPFSPGRVEADGAGAAHSLPAGSSASAPRRARPPSAPPPSPPAWICR